MTSTTGSVPADAPARRKPGRRPGGPSAARDRILRTADRLFYADGVRAVGIERVITEADVARVTFYRHFPAKDDLVLAYVGGRLEHDARELAQLRAAHPDDPRAVLEAIGDALVGEAQRTGFRGCPYLNVAGEYVDPEQPVRRAAGEHMAWLSRELRSLLTDAGHPDVELAVRELVMLRAGMMAIVATAGRDETLLASYRTAWDRVLDRRATG